MTPYPFQALALDKIWTAFDEFQRVLLVAPTGSGKTIIFAKCAEKVEGRSLILAARDELVQQAVDKLRFATGIEAEVEKAERRASLDARVVVGSVATLMRRNRRDHFPKDHFKLIVVDEAHHALADSYQFILNYFEAKVLGVTATPGRGDKKNLGKFFQTIAHEIGLLELIKKGYLSRITIKTVPIKIDLNGVDVVDGDYDKDQLDSTITPYLRAIAEEVAVNACFRRTLVFLPLIKTSVAFVEICRGMGLRAEHIDGNSEDRNQKLSRFARGEFDILSNAMLLIEGYDCPPIDCIVPLRPTRMNGLYCQMVGRGTRITLGKDELLLLDFLWLHEQHQLARPAHLIAGNDRIAQEISNVSADGKARDMFDLEREAIVNLDAQLQREATLREGLKENQHKQRRLIDAFEFCVSMKDVETAEYEPSMPWEFSAPTDPQKKVLKRIGIDPDSIKTKGHASKILDRIFQRSNLKLATPKQLALLRKHGHPAPETATFKEAGEFLDVKLARPTFGMKA